MTSREQFELVWKVSEISDDETLKQIAWAFWKASREAVEVELPTAEGEEGGITELIVDLCGEAIRAAGIKVKGE